MTQPTTVVPADARIFVAGHRGLVGSAIVRRLEAAGYGHVLTASREQLDLRDQAAVNYWFKAHRPEYVYLVAGLGDLLQVLHRTTGEQRHVLERFEVRLLAGHGGAA